MDQFVPGRRYYNCEEEDTDEPLNHRPPFAFPPPPSSPSSSSSARRAKQQMESTEDNRPSGSGGGGPSAPFVEKEHMFDKVVTPSDVGKLNRLVIPKQHAEKYFPLDASGGEKGLLLSFEDRTGKPWRFRYSYWNSSQSYVMTKGWSRFVKEKRLAAGDTVSFGRGVGEAVRHHLFIDWKRRPETPPAHPLLSHLPFPFHTTHHHLHRDPSSVMPLVVPWGRLVVPPPSSTVSTIAVYDRLWYGHNSAVSSNPYLYLRSAGNPSQVAVQLGIGSGGGEGGLAVPVVFDSVSAVQSNAAAKTVRLFGVNLGCSPSEADPGGDAAAHGRPPPPAQPPLQMRLGAPEVVEAPGIGQQPVSLDLEM